jgi:hypothetical protein
MFGMAQDDAQVTRLVVDPGVPHYSFARYSHLCIDGFELARKKIGDYMRFWPEGVEFITPDIPDFNILGEGH